MDSSHLSDQANWYVAYTYPNNEKKVDTLLKKGKITAFLPLQTQVRQWSDRQKKVAVPIFPNYVFVNIYRKEMYKITSVPGIVRMVAFDGRPAVVKEEEINTIKKLLQVDCCVVCPTKFIIGQKVRIHTGPLTGMQGILSRKNGEERVLITIEAVGKTLALNIPIEYLEKVVD